jgi:hypothetical protein
VAGTNVVIDATSERYAADFIQQSVRASSFSILQAFAGSPELTGKRPGPTKVTLPDGTVIERK